MKKWGKSYGVSKLVRLEDAEEEAVGLNHIKGGAIPRGKSPEPRGWRLGRPYWGKSPPMPSIRYPSRGVADTKKSRCGAEVSCSWR